MGTARAARAGRAAPPHEVAHHGQPRRLARLQLRPHVVALLPLLPRGRCVTALCLGRGDRLHAQWHPRRPVVHRTKLLAESSCGLVGVAQPEPRERQEVGR